MRSMPKATPPPSYIGEFEHLLLLAILQCGDQAYTVPIRRLIEARTGRRIARGALYTSLERLESKGLLTSRLSAPMAVRGGRARRYFTPTPTGIDAVRAAQTAVVRLAQGLETLLDVRP
jgi:PadR family transcriptional regulator PadR